MSTSITAGEIMDRSAVLMNDPSKTDYTYDVLSPLLKMALDELTESLIDGQHSPTLKTSSIMILPVGYHTFYPSNSTSVPNYPSDLVEIQQLRERTLGSDEKFIPVERVEYIRSSQPQDRLHYWSWEQQLIRFNPNGATTDREVELSYLRDFSATVITPDTNVGSISSRSYLAYKTAAYAAMFIGENPERAKVLDAQAEKALERIESINNKGRQQIMTRHRPFRATFKARRSF